jgi:phenylalanyl-tRNA synthetase beta chain
MNILVPDSWLREFLQTKATPAQIKEYLSLCGPSIERIHEGTIYDIEITTNRPDAMSVFGVAREASVILPRFGIPAELLNDPYQKKYTKKTVKSDKNLTIKTDPILNPRWTSVILENVIVKDSPKWLQDKLIKTGIRPINTIVDITNYLMRAFGQPAHAFDYDTIVDHTMILRASKKGEELTTLDGKKHILPGDDIVIEDGSEKLIDLCGIMGGLNSSITPKTKRVVLFLQTYEPVHIRKSMMKLSHRTEAGGLFEKGTDSELVMPAIIEGIRLAKQISGATVGSPIYDIYPKPYKSYKVSAKRVKVEGYIGKKLSDMEIKTVLTSLGFTPQFDNEFMHVTVPSFRRDVTIDVDIIEEIARIYGYHNIENRLPEGQVPIVMPDQTLYWEQEIKIRLRDWGFTELLTYSMMSEKQMEQFGLDKKTAYKISNPLSNDWEYMRPHLYPTVLEAVKQNLKISDNFKVFELSMVYTYQPNDLPKETPSLNIVWTGEKFLEAKGLTEYIFQIFGIEYKASVSGSSSLSFGEYGMIEILSQDLLNKIGINSPLTRVYLNFSALVSHANHTKTYIPIPKYPPIIEDLAFIVPEKFEVGPIIVAFKKAHTLIFDVSLLDLHENTRTFHITYQDSEKNLTDEDILPIRKKLITLAKEKYAIELKQ